MITKKTEFLFNMGSVVFARLTLSFRSWFLRGLSDDTVDDTVGEENVKDFRKHLQWSQVEDKEWFDRGGISILFYAIVTKRNRLVELLLESLDDVKLRKSVDVALCLQFPRVVLWKLESLAR